MDFGSILKLVSIEFLRFFHMWVEFVVGSLPRSERFFLRVLRFSPIQG